MDGPLPDVIGVADASDGGIDSPDTGPEWISAGEFEGTNPRLHSSRGGDLFLAWTTKRVGTNDRYVPRVARLTSANAWDSNYGPATGSPLVASPEVAVGSYEGGRPVLAWSQSNGGSPEQRFIHVAHWTGSQWAAELPPLRLNAAGVAYAPSMHVAEDGIVHIAWEEQLPGVGVPDFRVNEASGRSQWTAPSLIDSGHGRRPWLARTEGADFSAVSFYGSGGLNFVRTKRGSTVMRSQGYQSNTPMIALDGERPVVTWVGADGAIRVQELEASGSWKDYVPSLITEGISPQGPVLALEASGRPVIAWTESDSTQRVLRIARWTGSFWERSSVVDAVPGMGTDAGNPAVALSAGRILVAWEEGGKLFVRRWNR